MQSFAISKLTSAVALAAGAAALAAFGASPAVAAAPTQAASAAPTAVRASDPYTGQVTSPIGLNVRSAASTGASVLRTLNYNETFSIQCKVPAQNVDGNDLWYKLYHEQAWVSARYVANVGAAPRYCH